MLLNTSRRRAALAVSEVARERAASAADSLRNPANSARKWLSSAADRASRRAICAGRSAPASVMSCRSNAASADAAERRNSRTTTAISVSAVSASRTRSTFVFPSLPSIALPVGSERSESDSGE